MDIAFRGEHSPKNEIDFVFWYQRDHSAEGDEEPLLVFGEAKSFAVRSFEQKDVERMARLAEAFPGAFLVLATLKESLSEDEKASIGKLALSGRALLKDGRQRAPVIVLTGMELFSEWNIRHTWDGAGGQHKQFAAPYLELDNLWNLANVTQQLYLGLPDRHSRPVSGGA